MNPLDQASWGPWILLHKAVDGHCLGGSSRETHTWKAKQGRKRGENSLKMFWFLDSKKKKLKAGSTKRMKYLQLLRAIVGWWAFRTVISSRAHGRHGCVSTTVWARPARLWIHWTWGKRGTSDWFMWHSQNRRACVGKTVSNGALLSVTVHKNFTVPIAYKRTEILWKPISHLAWDANTPEYLALDYLCPLCTAHLSGLRKRRK